MAGFRKAKCEQAALKLGIYGPSGSGKTFTALLIAEGLAKLSGKRIAVVDTEHGTDFYSQTVQPRKVHPEEFDFDALHTRSLTEALAEIKKLKESEHACIILDSMTHLWEAARLAYEGRTTSIGSIPLHAWAQIKKPYKELINLLLSSPLHAIICGRQGIDYAADEESGELRAVGYKMKAEGETSYEPHILIRMEATRKKQNSEAVVTALVEKDRTGILAGKVIQWPSFDSVCKPLLPLLGGTQAKIQSDEEVAEQDSAALLEQERGRAEASSGRVIEFSAQFDLARNIEELEKVSKLLTPAVKKEMLPADVNKLREKYSERRREFSGGLRLDRTEVQT